MSSPNVNVKPLFKSLNKVRLWRYGGTSGKETACQCSIQFSCSVVSNVLWLHEPQHIRPPCPSPTPGVHTNPCPLSRWCHPTISSSVVPFSSCPQSFPASGSFQMSRSSHHVAKCRRCKRREFDPWVGKIPWRRAWQPTPVFCLFVCFFCLFIYFNWRITTLKYCGGFCHTSVQISTIYNS